MTLSGKVALVTGASRGIGKTIAIRLAADGALVAVHYGSGASGAEETVKTIMSAGGQAFVLQGRIDEVAEIDTMFENLDRLLTERTGQPQLDILVNNAGIDRFGTIEEITPEVFDELFRTNVRGTFFVTQRALARMRNNGRIVNLSSGLVRNATTRHTIYTMAKGAIDKLTMVLAQHVGERGITVNSVAPGATPTDMTASWLTGNEEIIVGITALRRVGQPQDIADIVAFLASDRGRWVTANWIDATGGQSL